MSCARRVFAPDPDWPATAERWAGVKASDLQRSRSPWRQYYKASMTHRRLIRTIVARP
jgi:hypothetical protein